MKILITGGNGVLGRSLRKELQKFRKANDNYVLKVFSEKYIFKPKFIV